MKSNRIKLGIASVFGAAALALPAAAGADVNVKVGSANVTLPVRNCERVQAGTPDQQTVTIPEIRVPVTVGPVLPDLGAVTVRIGDDVTNVPINGEEITITVDSGVDERGTTTPPKAEAEGPEPTQVSQEVTLPASANLIGAQTPEDVAASSCKAEAPATQPEPQPEPGTEPQPEPQPEPSTEPQPQPEPQPQAQPEQPQSNTQGSAPAETPAQPTSQTTTTTHPHPATTGQDTAKKSKQAKKKSKPKKSKSKSKKGKKSKSKSKKGKGRRN